MKTRGIVRRPAMSEEVQIKAALKLALIAANEKRWSDVQALATVAVSAAEDLVGGRP